MKTPSLSGFRRALLFLAAMACVASVARAGTWSTAPWTGDSSTYIASPQTVWAYHFGSATAATVNGVSVPGLVGGSSPITSAGQFTITGLDQSVGSDTNNLTALGGTGTAVMAASFIYNGNPGTVTISGLTSGQAYTVTFFGVDFGGTRICTFTSGTDSAVIDENQFGNKNGIRVDYTFLATATTRSVTITPQSFGTTWHLYGLALRLESNPTQVTNTNDSGTGSLRWALANAAAISGANTVTFDAALSGQTITTATEYTVADAGGVTIDASALAAPVSIAGSGAAHRLFTHTAGSLTLRRLRLQDGRADATASVSPNIGGAVYSSGSSFAAFDCSFVGNQARFTGGALAIATSAASTIEGSTFTTNTTTADNGASGAAGAILHTAPLVVRKSTLHLNSTFTSATGFTAGAIVTENAALTLEHSTVTQNTSSGSVASRAAVHIRGTGSAVITNCIVAENLGGGFDINNSTGVAANLQFGGANIVQSFNPLSTGTAPLNVAPLLGSFGTNGGSTDTRAPQFGSPAIDVASVIAGHAIDQRGVARPFDGDGNGTATPDLGAVEARFPIVSNGNDSGTGSLRQAVADAATFDGPDTIVFRSASFPTGGTVNLTTSLTMPAAGDTAGVTLSTTVLAGNVDVAVNAGTFTWNEGSNWTGGGRVLLGATSGIASATVEIADSNGLTVLAAPVVVRAGSSGPKTLRDSNANALFPNTFAGAITLLAPATIEKLDSGVLQFTADLDLGAHLLSVSGTGTGPVNFNGRVFRSDGTGTAQLVHNGASALRFTGSGDNTRLALTVNTGGAEFSKTSSPSVHAVGGGLTAADAPALTLAAGRSVISNGGDQIADTASVTVNGTLSITGDETIGALNGTGAVNVPLGTRTLTVGAGDGTGDFGGALQFGTAVIKTGTGIQTLSGNNTNTAAVTVSGGTLNVTGTLPNISGTTVQTGGTIAGTGSVGASLTLENGSNFAPGNATLPANLDTLTVASSATWKGGATARFHLSTTDNSSDRLALGGALTKGTVGSFNFDFQGTGVSGQTYTLATFASSDFAVTDFSYSGLAPGLVGYFTKTATSLTFTVTAFSSVVTTTADSGPGSLRQIIADAAQIPGANTITFPASLSGATVSLSSDIVVDDSTGGVTLDGSNLPGGLTIDGGAGNNRIFTVTAGDQLTLRALTLTGGNGSGANGGAILNDGTLVLERCTLANNSAVSGGAIFNSGVLTASNSTFAENSATTGGAVTNQGGAAVPALVHCTLARNTASDSGGALAILNGSLVISNSLVASNTAPSGADIANSASPITDLGVNFIGNLAGSGLVAGPDVLTGDPRLARLADNGGPTQTMALRPGSAAIDPNNALVASVDTDQRGFPRTRQAGGVGAVADLGAYEAQVAPVSGVGFNFVGGGSGGPGGTLAPTDVAGSPEWAQGNWNNLTDTADGTLHDGTYTGRGPVPLLNASGNAFAPNLRIWWSSHHLWNISPAPQSTPDRRLMNGYLDSNVGGPGYTATDLYASFASQPFFAVSGLPSAPGGYKVIVYTDGDANDRVGEYWLTTNRASNPANVVNERDLTRHTFVRDGTNFSNTFTRVPSSSTANLGLSTPAGNYAVFEGITESGFIVRAEEAVTSSPINAVQIVRNEIVVVTTTADELDANGVLGAGISLREALRDTAPGGGILFDSSLNGATLALDSVKGEIVIAKDVTIDASNLANGLTIDGGTGTNRIFSLSGSGKTATLIGLTLSGGNGRGTIEDNAGGAIVVHDGAWLNAVRCTFASNSAQSGGAIYNSFSTVSLDGCSFTSNGALGGGAIGSSGSVSAIDSTFSGNVASVDGGVFYNQDGTLTLTRCTLSGNTANSDGGAIRNFGLLKLTHCTVAGNTAGGAIGGGGIDHVRNFLTIENSIVAGNSLTGTGSGADIRFFFQVNFSTFTRIGANIIQSIASNGSPSGPAHLNVNPQLAALANNGGPTQTRALLTGSPARNGAVGSTNPNDQRGIAIVGVPDIGAYEANDVVTTNYNAWSTAVAGSVLPSGDDTEKDGAINVLEYALRRDPNVNDSSLNPTLTGPVGGRLFSFRYQATANDLRYIVQRNTDLTNNAGWTEIYRYDSSTGAVTELFSVTGDENASTQVITLTDPAPGTKLFWRLRIELIP